MCVPLSPKFGLFCPRKEGKFSSEFWFAWKPLNRYGPSSFPSKTISCIAPPIAVYTQKTQSHRFCLIPRGCIAAQTALRDVSRCAPVSQLARHSARGTKVVYGFLPLREHRRKPGSRLAISPPRTHQPLGLPCRQKWVVKFFFLCEIWLKIWKLWWEKIWWSSRGRLFSTC